MERTLHMLLYRAFHAQRNALRPCFTQLGLGAGQPKLLGYLSRNGASSQRQLADYFEVDPAAVSRMLDSLQKGGFVTRRPDDTDRRRDLVELTPAGRQAYERWQAFCGEVEAQMLQGFTPQERETFSAYLHRAYQNLKGERGEQDEGL